MDQHVSKRLFQECIRGHLKNSTVILVTHQLQYLSQCDFVVFLDHGALHGSGRYDALIQSDADFSTLIKTHVGKRSKEEAVEPTVAPKAGDTAYAFPHSERLVAFLAWTLVTCKQHVVATLVFLDGW